jgi:hypothetical protein
MRTLRYVALLLFVSLGTALCAKADDIFSLTKTTTHPTFSAGNGVGQAVYVDTTTAIDSFGFFMDQTGGGQVNFFILDESNNDAVIVNDTVAAPGSTKAWTYLDGFDVTLDAGQTYIFGVYGDNNLTVGLDPSATSSDGLSLPVGPSSYDFTGLTQGAAISGSINSYGLSTADVGLQVADAPEPSSLMLLGSGILAGAAVLRRKLVR